MLYQPPRLLLGKKKLGLGIGYWNGFGGKVEEGENIEDSAKREVLEEAGIRVQSLTKIGELEFFAPSRSPSVVHLFSSNNFSGEPTESEEMMPQWFTTDALPVNEMWSSDAYWYPLFWQARSLTVNSYLMRETRLLSTLSLKYEMRHPR
jgi:8-oxo-dGTP diphosphatase/2-hydroxy-dATP diphosphatase